MQGYAPQRAWATLVSHDKDLYLYGGLPHHRVNQRSVNLDGTVFVDDGESRIMKLDHNTNTWQAVSDEGAAPETWYNWPMQNTGRSCTAFAHLRLCVPNAETDCLFFSVQALCTRTPCM